MFSYRSGLLLSAGLRNRSLSCTLSSFWPLIFRSKWMPPFFRFYRHGDLHMKWQFSYIKRLTAPQGRKTAWFPVPYLRNVRHYSLSPLYFFVGMAIRAVIRYLPQCPGQWFTTVVILGKRFVFIISIIFPFAPHILLRRTRVLVISYVYHCGNSVFNIYGS